MKLIKPNINYIDEIQAFKHGFVQNWKELHGSSQLSKYSDIKKWVEYTSLLENNPPEYCVRTSTYMAVHNNKIVGMCDFKHSFSHPVINRWGGNIACCIHPKERKKGDGAKMLNLLLCECMTWGIRKVLVTAKPSNIGSNRLIQANYGIFEKEITIDDGTKYNRYWIFI
ncbi:MAG: hypothetical protein ATN32_04385 [Candidatus Epulonipiscium fishelsonii]|nr:MAG: hypothetical protein ATN32_04385 [Epulopiscium sp. AS2M-Bin002]